MNAQPSPATLEYGDLCSMARRLMTRESRECTLTATGLVHEFYLRLAKYASASSDLAAQHLPLATRVMRQILVDRARRRQTRKKAENNYSVALTIDHQVSQPRRAAMEKTLQLEAALEILEREMPETAELVRLRVYLDLSLEAAANQLKLSRATAYRKWNFAKAWLTQHLQWPL